MSDLRSVVLAIEHATRRRDGLAQIVGRYERNLINMKEQMAQLKGYAMETETRWTGSGPRQTNAELIRHQYLFMDRLYQAITLQTDVIADGARQVDQAKANLLQAEFRLAGLNQVLKTRRAGLLRLQRNREQRHMDEFAAMVHARGRVQPMSGEKNDY